MDKKAEYFINKIDETIKDGNFSEAQLYYNKACTSIGEIPEIIAYKEIIESKVKNVEPFNSINEKIPEIRKQKVLNKKIIILPIIMLVGVIIIIAPIIHYSTNSHSTDGYDVSNNWTDQNNSSYNNNYNTVENREESSTSNNTVISTEPTNNTSSNDNAYNSSGNTNNNRNNTTEAICANGHSWVAITKTVHHDEVGHYEDVIVGYDTLTIYKCFCYKRFNSYEEYYSHFQTAHIAVEDENVIIFLDRYETEEQSNPIYETQWIVDTPSYDEEVTTGYKCSVCGQQK